MIVVCGVNPTSAAANPTHLLPHPPLGAPDQYTNHPSPWPMHNSIARCKYSTLLLRALNPVSSSTTIQLYSNLLPPLCNPARCACREHRADRTPPSDLLRRLNPRDTKANVQAIASIVPDLTEDLLSSVDQPLEIRQCPQSNRDYLLCDYNRDGDSYRSPWSNEFDPPLDDGTVPSERVRKLEVASNEAFDVYRELYYEGGVGSVYFWDLDDGFAGVVLLKKGKNVLYFS